MSTISWSEIYKYRLEVRNKYPSFYKISFLKKLKILLKRHIYTGVKVLDFGAGNKSLKETLTEINEDINYKSLDIDNYHDHDYTSHQSLPAETFDLVVMSEVVEHMTPEEAMESLTAIYKTLKRAGVLIITTPNVMHPNRFFFDATHKTPFRYDELGGFLKVIGFERIQFFRQYNDAFHRKILKKYVFSLLFRFLEIDFAPTLTTVAEKPHR